MGSSLKSAVVSTPLGVSGREGTGGSITGDVDVAWCSLPGLAASSSLTHLVSAPPDQVLGDRTARDAPQEGPRLAKTDGSCDCPEQKLNCLRIVKAEQREPGAPLGLDAVIETNEMAQLRAVLNKTVLRYSPEPLMWKQRVKRDVPRRLVYLQGKAGSVQLWRNAIANPIAALHAF